MNPPDTITDEQISAFVDGELNAADRSKLEAWLASHPDDAARVDAYVQLNSELSRLHHDVMVAPVPARLLAALEAPKAPRQHLIWVRMAAALALLIAGGLGGWVLRDQQDAPFVIAVPSFVERAVGAHFVYSSEVLHPVEVEANREEHLVTWLSKRLGNPLKAPRLASLGYQLIGGRLLEETGSPAAQFMYEDSSGRRVTVYVRSYEGKDTAFKYFQSGDVAAFYWIDSPFAYALAGELPRNDLMEISRLVYQGLTP